MGTSWLWQLWSVPNLLSLYRLLAAPVLAWLVVHGDRAPFTVLLLISLLSDILDGLIARVFDLQTTFGARLDSWADTLTYWAAIAGVLRFAWPAVVEHCLLLLSFVALAQLLNLAMLVKFHLILGLHSYSFKITAYLQGLAALQLLWTQHWSWLCDLALVWGLVACIEELLIVRMLEAPMSDVKGLLWLRRQAPGAADSGSG